jgi:hypothetical protein
MTWSFAFSSWQFNHVIYHCLDRLQPPARDSSERRREKDQNSWSTPHITNDSFYSSQIYPEKIDERFLFDFIDVVSCCDWRRCLLWVHQPTVSARWFHVCTSLDPRLVVLYLIIHFVASVSRAQDITCTRL